MAPGPSCDTFVLLAARQAGPENDHHPDWVSVPESSGQKGVLSLINNNDKAVSVICISLNVASIAFCSPSTDCIVYLNI